MFTLWSVTLRRLQDAAFLIDRSFIDMIRAALPLTTFERLPLAQADIYLC